MKYVAWFVFLTFIGVSAVANYLHGHDRLGGALMAVVPIGFAAVMFLLEALVARGKGSYPLYTAAAVVGGGAGIASYVGLATMALDHKVPAIVAYLLPLAYDGVVVVASLAIRGLGPDHRGLDRTTVDQSRSTPVDHVDHSSGPAVDHSVDHPVQAPWTTPVHPVRTTPVQTVDHSVDQSVNQPWSAGQSPVQSPDQMVDHPVDHSSGPAVDYVDQTAWTTVDQSVDRSVDHGGPAVDQTAVDRVDRTVDQVVQSAVDQVVQWTDLTDKEKADRTTKAVQEVLDGKSINGAAKANGVPKSTLIRKVKDAQTPVVVTDAKPELKAIEAAGIDLDAELAELLSNDKTKEA